MKPRYVVTAKWDNGGIYSYGPIPLEEAVSHLGRVAFENPTQFARLMIEPVASPPSA
jgi:hypothetical protein